MENGGEEIALMTGVEAAQYLGLTRSALYKIMERGDLERVDTGKAHQRERLLFRRDDVERYMAATLERRRQERQQKRQNE